MLVVNPWIRTLKPLLSLRAAGRGYGGYSDLYVIRPGNFCTFGVGSAVAPGGKPKTQSGQ